MMNTAGTETLETIEAAINDMEPGRDLDVALAEQAGWTNIAFYRTMNGDALIGQAPRWIDLPIDQDTGLSVVPPMSTNRAALDAYLWVPLLPQVASFSIVQRYWYTRSEGGYSEADYKDPRVTTGARVQLTFDSGSVEADGYNQTHALCLALLKAYAWGLVVAPDAATGGIKQVGDGC